MCRYRTSRLRRYSSFVYGGVIDGEGEKFWEAVIAYSDPLETLTTFSDLSNRSFSTVHDRITIFKNVKDQLIMSHFLDKLFFFFCWHF